MPSFTEYVKLIAEGNEAIAVINRINEAIAKMRREASQPIHVKIKSDVEAQVAGERRIRAEKKKTVDQEEAAIHKLKAERSAIKRMNEEQGNAPHNIRLGSPQSIAQAQRFNEQLEESTKRINRLADAHKHIKQTAKAADVEVSHSLSERLAAQTVGRTEKSDAQAVKDAAAAQAKAIKDAAAAQAKAAKDAADKRKEFDRQMAQGLTRSEQIQKKADSAAIAAENERLRLSKKRFEEEMKAERIIGHMEKERIRVEEAEKRKQAQLIRDAERAEHRERRQRETQLASIRESGIRGFVGEIHRDVRRNMVYGGIGYAEHLAASAYEADKSMDTAKENLRQAGRTPSEIATMQKNALKLSMQNPSVNAAEMLTMQQHNVGAFGDFNKGMANNEFSARYLATRKGKVGEEKALDENLAILKIGEETGHIRDSSFMKKLYDQQLKIAQAEGAQYNPESMLTMVRQLKSSKYGLSDETLLNILPFAGIGEGASRIGNQVAMLQKSMGFEGKSLSKDNQKTIAGTVLSNGAGGYNKEIFQNVASGDLGKLATIVDKFFTQKGFDPNDKSRANISNEMTLLGKAIGNTNAREILTLLTENRDQIKKEQENAARSQGLLTPQQATRTLTGAQDAVVAQGQNAATKVLEPFNPLMIKVMNGVAVVEQWVANNPKSTLGAAAGIGGLGIAAMIKSAWENPAQAANTTAIIANTGAVTLNTGSRALGGGVPGGPGKLFGANPFLVGAAIGTAVQMGIIQPWIDDKKNLAQEGLVNKYRNDLQLREKVIAQVPALIAHGDFNHGDKDDPRPTLDALQNQLRIAVEAQRRNERDMAELMAKHKAEEREKYYPSVDSYHDRHPFITTPMPKKEEELPYKQSWTAPWRLGDSTQQGGVFNSGGIMNNGSGTARQQQLLDESSAQAAIAKISEAGGGAASALESVGGALKEGAGVAASAISGAGSSIVDALSGIAAKIAGIRIQGPATAGPQAPQTGTREKGPP